MNHDDKLTPEEQKRLEQLEQTIRSADLSYIAKGRALREINSSNLFRAEFADFPKYCSAKWQMAKSHCYRLIRAVDVVEHLEKVGLPVPANEYQARALAAFADDFDVVEKVWRAIQDSGKPITANLIEELHDQMFQKKDDSEQKQDGKEDGDGNISPSGDVQPHPKPSFKNYEAIITGKATPEAIVALAKILGVEPPANTNVGNFTKEFALDEVFALFCDCATWVGDAQPESFSLELKAQ
jgi:hypothetical protein